MPFPIFVLVFAAAQSAHAPPDPPPKPMLICRASEREVGSRIRKGRQCKTAEEWQLEDARRESKPAGMRITEGQSIPTGAPGSPH